MKALQFTFIIQILFILNACDPGSHSEKRNKSNPNTKNVAVSVPEFNADSAFHFVAKQLAFGPRVPQSEAHQACASWLGEKMSEYADTLYLQHFRTRIYDQRAFDGVNIIGVFNPKARKRIVLASHWDSRPYADYDADPGNHHSPIDGANDGASGTAVLLEIARLLKTFPISEQLGIDIVFFDLEDYGPPTSDRNRYSEESWALGSQHWSRHPHTPSYRANFGILLDMVGGADPVFPREYFSQQYASWVLDRVWLKAYELGYGNLFVNKPGSPINDDHVPMNEIAGIPTINIIHLDPSSSNGTFFEHWHTVADNLDAIDKETLRIVGRIVTHTIYNEQ
ncbi:MAG: M28 family peptidase [Bacteroidales bacterium]|nr:M28 family peptidase [Bacteroidales bacterium]